MDDQDYLILDLAERVLGGRDRALRWLAEKQPGLGNRTPAELLRTRPGAEQVRQYLLRLDGKANG
jgi:uncharacterized protein (DUF2384 family)